MFKLLLLGKISNNFAIKTPKHEDMFMYVNLLLSAALHNESDLLHDPVEGGLGLRSTGLDCQPATTAKCCLFTDSSVLTI